MRENISPEEKLLGVIKKGTDNTKGNVPQQPVQGVPHKEVPDAEGLVKKDATVAVPRKISVIYVKSLSILNKFLIIAGLCVVVYMVLSYMYPYRPNPEISGHVEPENGEELLGKTPEPPPPVSYYADVLSRRQMFKLYEVPKPKAAGPAKPKVTIQQLLAGYTVIGVVFGDVPQAIVEEKRTGQSFYLTAGQFLGQLKIEKIERGRITVSYEDETMAISI